MKYIEKSAEPSFLADYRKRHPSGSYGDRDFRPYKQELRQILVKEQHGLCAYCCRKISAEAGKSHIEHIEPRHGMNGRMSRKSLWYSNMVASCEDAETCGKAKKDTYDVQRFISPLSPDCEKRITYLLESGEVEVTEDNYYTVALLNLNEYRLTCVRRAIGLELDALLNSMDEDLLGNPDFVSRIAEEVGCADYIEQYLERRGFSARKSGEKTYEK